MEKSHNNPCVVFSKRLIDSDDLSRLNRAVIINLDICQTKDLLLSGINPNIKNEENQTVLSSLIKRKYLKVNYNYFLLIDLLLEFNANPHLKDIYGKSAIDYARENKFSNELIDRLEKTDPIPSLQQIIIEKFINSIHHKLFTYDQIKKYLHYDLKCKLQEELEKKSLNDFDQLYLAIKDENIPLLKQHLINGLNINVTNQFNFTPLTNAIWQKPKLHQLENNFLKMIKFLIKMGASPYIQTKVEDGYLNAKNIYEVMIDLQIKPLLTLFNTYKFPTLKSLTIKKIGNQILLGQIKKENVQKILSGLYRNKAEKSSVLYRSLEKYLSKMS